MFQMPTPARPAQEQSGRSRQTTGFSQKHQLLGPLRAPGQDFCSMAIGGTVQIDDNVAAITGSNTQ
jgi:hypothetical protein